MLVILDGVKLYGLNPQAALAMSVCASIFEKNQHDCYVTSANDKTHSMTSLHYSGSAFDLRSHHIASEEEKIVLMARMRKALGSDYDVLLEDKGKPNEHFHVEWQPRRPA